MKRILALALILVLVLGMSVTASAEGEDGKFVVSSAEALPGEEVKLTIDVKGAVGVAGIELDLEYNDSVLEWTDVTLEVDGFKSAAVGTSITWYGDDDFTGDFTFATLTFKVKEDAAPQETAVTVTYKEGNVYNFDEVDQDMAIEAGKVTVKALEPAIADGFYLIGVNGWTEKDIAETDKFEVNPENTAEYMLKTNLEIGKEIKVVEVKDGKIAGWYPDGIDNNYTVDEPHSGDVTIYFKPYYDNAWSGFGGYFYIPAKEEPKAQIELYGVSTTLGGQIGLNFLLVPTDEQLNDEGFKVTLANGAAVKEFALKDGKVRTWDGRTMYQFTFALTAKQMSEKVEIKAVNGSGEAVALYRPIEKKASESFSFSVVDYLNKVVAEHSNEDLKALAKAMSDFGSLTQVYVPYNTENRAALWNLDAVTGVSAADLAPYMAEVTGGDVVALTGSTLVLDDQTDLRIYLEAKDGALTDYTYQLDGKAATLKKNNTCIEVSNIAANKLDLFHTLVVKNSAGDTVLTVKICALSYAYSTVTNSDNQNLINAVKALYLYNQKADAYFK